MASVWKNISYLYPWSTKGKVSAMNRKQRFRWSEREIKFCEHSLNNHGFNRSYGKKCYVLLKFRIKGKNDKILQILTHTKFVGEFYLFVLKVYRNVSTTCNL